MDEKPSIMTEDKALEMLEESLDEVVEAVEEFQEEFDEVEKNESE